MLTLMGDATEERLDAAALDRRRPMLVRTLLWMAPLVFLGAIMFGWEFARATSQPAVAVAVLVVVFGATVLGAFLIGRRRQRTIREGRDGRVLSRRPGWLGYALAIIPGFVLVAAQAVSRASEQTGNTIALFAVYVLATFLGLTLGLVVSL